jgi:hypothetical protein
MALQGPIPVEFGNVFPEGVYATGGFEPVRDFDASTNGRFVQSKDKNTGLPLWQVEVIDAEKDARNRTVKVKVPSTSEPGLPSGSSGMPFTPVEFVDMTVTPYVNQSGRLAYSIKAAGVRAPGRSAGKATQPAQDGKAA